MTKVIGNKEIPPPGDDHVYDEVASPDYAPRYAVPLDLKSVNSSITAEFENRAYVKA